MPLIDTKTGKSWSDAAIRLAHDTVRDGVSMALTGRDRARGIPESGHVYVESEISATAAGQRLVVDPALAALKHTGGEHKRLVLARWAKFCSERRSEAEFMAKHATVEQDAKKATIAAADDVEQSLKDALPDDKPAKPGPGRPTNAQRAAKAEAEKKAADAAGKTQPTTVSV